MGFAFQEGCSKVVKGMGFRLRPDEFGILRDGKICFGLEKMKIFMSYNADFASRDKSRSLRLDVEKCSKTAILMYRFHVQLESISASIQKLCSIMVLHFGH